MALFYRSHGFKSLNIRTRIIVNLIEQIVPSRGGDIITIVFINPPVFIWTRLKSSDLESFTDFSTIPDRFYGDDLRLV